MYGDRVLYVADDVKQRLVAVDLREGGRKVLLSGRKISSIAVDRSGLLYVMEGKSGDIVVVEPTGQNAGTVPLRSIVGEGEEAEKLVRRAGEVWVKLVGGKIARPRKWIFEKGNPPVIEKRDDRLRTRFLRGGAMQIAVARGTDGENHGDWRDVVIEGKPRDAAMEYLGVDGTGHHYLLIECLGEDGEVEAYVRKLDAAGEVPDTVVFHAGTAEKDGKIVTAGGRVLGVTSLGDTVEEAIGRAYEAVSLISWKEVQYRRDIGAKAVAR